MQVDLITHCSSNVAIDVEPCVMSRVGKRRCWAAFFSSLPGRTWVGAPLKLGGITKKNDAHQAPHTRVNIFEHFFLHSGLASSSNYNWRVVKSKRHGRGSLASQDTQLITGLWWTRLLLLGFGWIIWRLLLISGRWDKQPTYLSALPSTRPGLPPSSGSPESNNGYVLTHG